jgi:hypothetical protein
MMSPRDLLFMSAFAEAWPEKAIVQRVVAQLPWGLAFGKTFVQQHAAQTTPPAPANRFTAPASSSPCRKELKGILPSVEEIEKEFAE